MRGSGSLLDPAFTDDLTGVANRRYLRRLLDEQWQALAERHHRIALLLLDLDGFKQVNDRYGHLTGDAVLRATAAVLSESFRDGDRVVRYGGDEFVVVLPGAGSDEAHELAVRARRAVEQVRWQMPVTGARIESPISFSVGVASSPEDGAEGETVLASADRRLYEEKERHRERMQTTPRRRPARWGWAAAAAVLLAAAVVVWAPRRESQLVAPPGPSPASVARSAANAAEIERLKNEVERLRSKLAQAQGPAAPDASGDRGGRAASQSGSTSDRAASTADLARIRELEDELAAAQSPQPRTGDESAGGVVPSASPPASTPQGATSSTLPVPAPPPAATSVGVSAAPTFEPPQLLSRAKPLYPPLARRSGIEAEIEIAVRVDAEGHVVSASPIGKSVGFGFEEAARAAALSASYRPARRDGRPVEATTTLLIKFRLSTPR